MNENFNLIETALITIYNKEQKSNSWAYLTIEQIQGIIDYLMDDLNIDLGTFDVQSFIDNQLINGLGFDEQGQPIYDEQE